MSNLGKFVVLPILMFIKGLIDPNVEASRWLQSLHNAEKLYKDNEIVGITSLNNHHFVNFNKTLSKILKVRVPDTDQHREVNNFIKTSLTRLGWTVEEDVFKSETPIGQVTFRNIIATFNSKSCKRLVFACHYDSKLFKNGNFLGATDSAVPCTMLIEMARNLNDLLINAKNSEISLQFLFFDGEEAFKTWTNKDSLYGSRHLAELWNKKKFPVTDEDKTKCSSYKMYSELDRIDLFVLLDLIGSTEASFYSFFPQTNSLFKRLISIENDLNRLKLLETQSSSSSTNYFQKRQMLGDIISDDHVPFVNLDVNVLHIIPYPFPKVWHKLTDNQNALHHSTINNLMKIFQLFISSYLHL